MKFTYMKTPLRRYTFENRRIREWVEQHVEGDVLNLFAGKTFLNCREVRNDLREEMPAHYHMDALELVKGWDGKPFDTVILDPPYAYRKSMTKYDGAVSSPFNKVKDEIVRILSVEGIVITFGYHSNVMGEKRGFQQDHLLVMSHGGAIHDTIAIIERKVKDRINEYFDCGQS
jgi:23S rRNA G2069 N7-methylase RlmK/C1962 C5-methylase RlmI